MAIDALGEVVGGGLLGGDLGEENRSASRTRREITAHLSLMAARLFAEKTTAGSSARSAWSE